MEEGGEGGWEEWVGRLMVGCLEPGQTRRAFPLGLTRALSPVALGQAGESTGARPRALWHSNPREL